jgi:hypothetical protein
MHPVVGPGGEEEEEAAEGEEGGGQVFLNEARGREGEREGGRGEFIGI